VRDSPEVNVLWDIVHGAQKTVTANIYLDMLQLFAFPEEGKEEGGRGNIPKLRFPNRWIGRDVPKPWTHEVHSSHN
jgi:hypothetical protein